MIKNHDLKCWPKYFSSVESGEKTFEYRKNDRNFEVGDLLTLREWEPVSQSYTGNVIQKRVSYIFKLAEPICSGCGEVGYVILAIKDLWA